MWGWLYIMRTGWHGEGLRASCKRVLACTLVRRLRQALSPNSRSPAAALYVHERGLPMEEVILAFRFTALPGGILFGGPGAVPVRRISKERSYSSAMISPRAKRSLKISSLVPGPLRAVVSATFGKDACHGPKL